MKRASAWRARANASSKYFWENALIWGSTRSARAITALHQFNGRQGAGFEARGRSFGGEVAELEIAHPAQKPQFARRPGPASAVSVDT